LKLGLDAPMGLIAIIILNYLDMHAANYFRQHYWTPIFRSYYSRHVLVNIMSARRTRLASGSSIAILYRFDD
jgi:hypothetical protein